MSKNKKIIIQVKGTNWEVVVLTRAMFNKAYPDSTNAEALTDPNEKSIFIVKDHLNFETALHEVIHAFRFECHTTSMTEESPEDREEHLCEIVSANFFQLGQLALEITIKLGKK